jgi:hypothetical protein
VRALVACLIVATVGCFRSAAFEPTEPDASAEQDATIPDGCECAEGPCCDGCHFLAADVVCVDDGMIGPATCAGWSEINEPGNRRIASPLGDRYCSGASSLCDGMRAPRGAAAVETDCGSGNYGLPGRPNVYCREDDSALGASCVPAP